MERALKVSAESAMKKCIESNRLGRHIPMRFIGFRELRSALCVRWNPAVLCLAD
jgi:hypothetical protein